MFHERENFWRSPVIRRYATRVFDVDYVGSHR
jgi:hypothetical protein